MVNHGLDDQYWREPEPEFRGEPPDEGLRKFVRLERRLRHHVLFRTSGSSGLPRWVALSKDALRWSAQRVNEHLDCSAGDCWGCALPAAHVGGYGILARAALTGGKVAMFSGKWSGAGFAEFCRREQVTVTSLVPTQVYDLVCANLRCPAPLRVAVIGGGALSPELAARAWDLGWPVRGSYGMTETASQIATERESSQPGAGLPLISPWQAKVDGEGRIWVRGGGLFSGYVVPGETEATLEAGVGSDGWFRTSDLGRMLGPGRLLVDGRAERMVKILGELVSLDRLDRVWEAVCGEPGASAVLSALPDERRGFAVVVVTEGDEDASELQHSWARFDGQVAPYERIQRVLRVREIPRTELGKVRHAELRRLLDQKSG